MASVEFPNTNITDLDMQKFRSISSAAGGPAKSNRFIVEITGGPVIVISNSVQRDLMFLCEAAELPGRGFMSTDVRYYGPNFKAPYQTVYEDLNLTFICRDQFYEREIFDDWMNIINPVRSFNFEYKDTYTSTIRLHQFSDTENKSNYTFTFDKAYPILVSPQPATWADDNFHRLTVSFTYVRWYREGLDTPLNTSGPTETLIADRLRLLGLEESIRNTPTSNPRGNGFTTGGGF
jgi:hypothetical protein